MNSSPSILVQPGLYYIPLDATGTAATGPAVRVITPDTGYYLGSFILSPDGTKVLYELINHTTGVAIPYVANIDGSSPIPMTSTPATIGYLMWSPDSSKVAFQYGDTSGATRYLDLYVANADGTGLTNLTNFSALSAVSTRTDYMGGLWSSDGSKILGIYEYLDTFIWNFGWFNVDDLTSDVLIGDTGNSMDLIDWWQIGA